MRAMQAHASDAGPRGSTGPWVKSYVAVVVAMMAIQAASLGFAPLIPFMKDAWGMTYSQVGTFTGVYGIVALIMSVPAGLLAKRYGEKRVLWAGMLISATGLAAVSMAGNYAQGLGARTVWIFGYRLAFICVVTALALTVPLNWRGKAQGLLGALAALATVLGSTLAAGMQGLFGWRHSMLGFAGIALAGCAWFVACYRQTAREPAAARGGDGAGGDGAGGDGAGGNGMFAVFRRPIVWVIPILGLTNAAGFAATFFVPSVVRTVFHLGAEQAATIISASYALAIVVNPLCGWFADRYNRWSVMAAIVIVMIPACLLMSVPNLYVFGAATAVLVAFGHAAANQIYPTAATLVPGGDTGPVMGIVGLGSGLFGYLGPQALGWLRDWSGGFDLGWRAITATTVGILALVLYLRHRSLRIG